MRWSAIAFQLEKMDALKRQIRSAMMYPAFVFTAAILIMLAVVIFIVPVFADAFKEAVADQPGESADLPTMTQIMIGISNFVKDFWFIWVPGTIGGFIAFFQWKKTDTGRAQWDRLKLKLPFHIGDIVRKVAVARWSRTFAGAVGSGVPLLQSIKLVGQTSGNAVVEQSMDDVYASVKSRRHSRPPDRGERGVPADGRAHDVGGRGDRPARADAHQGRRLLRGRGGLQGEGPHVAARADR